MTVEDFKKNDFGSCKLVNKIGLICSDIFEDRVWTITEVKISNDLLGYIFKEKTVEIKSGEGFPILTILLFLITIVFIYLLTSIFIFIDNSVRKPLLNLQETIMPILEGESSLRLNTNFIEELQTVSEQVSKIIKKYEERKEASVLVDVSMQVSHDIRSPLSTLNIILSQLKHVPEDQILILKSSVNRINDIANQLLNRAKLSQNRLVSNLDLIISEEVLNYKDLYNILDVTVFEKNLQYSDVKIDCKIENSKNVYINFDSNKLKVVLSNIINNSVEAFHGSDGKIFFSFSKSDNFGYITVCDSGQGISKELLNKIGQKGFSYGKENMEQSGSGLGLYHAKKTMQEFGGELLIDSELGVGTTVTLKIPLADQQ